MASLNDILISIFYWIDFVNYHSTHYYRKSFIYTSWILYRKINKSLVILWIY